MMPVRQVDPLGDFVRAFTFARQQKLQGDEHRMRQESFARELAEATEAAAERKRQRQLVNLKTAMDLEGARADAGTRELPGPPAPGEEGVFSAPERESIDYGDLGPIDVKEIERIANAKARRTSGDRARAQASQALEDEYRRTHMGRAGTWKDIVDDQGRVIGSWNPETGERRLLPSEFEGGRKTAAPRPPKPARDPREITDADMRSYRREARQQLMTAFNSGEREGAPTTQEIDALAREMAAQDSGVSDIAPMTSRGEGPRVPPPALPAGGGRLPVVKSPEEARKLPSGTMFQTPDGRTMRVP